MTEYVNVEDYFVTDWDQAFQDALLAADHVKVGFGTFPVTQPIVMSNGKRIEGSGVGRTTITSTTANQPVIRLPTSTVRFQIDGMRLTHSGAGVPATAGGDGVQSGPGTVVDNGLIRDVSSDFNHIGFNLGMTGNSVIDNSAAGANVSHGFLFSANGANTLQWFLRGCIALQNGNDGYRWETTGSGGFGTSVGEMTNCTTFNNTWNGVVFQGSASNPLQSARLEGGFYGQDQGHGVYLDTFGRVHNINPEFVEISGQCGIYISLNNEETNVRAGQIYNNGEDGLFTFGRNTTVTGGKFISNGRAGTSGRQNGIYAFEDASNPRQAQLVGVRCTNIPGPPVTQTQVYGVAGTSSVQVVGADLRGNATAAFSAAPHASSTGNRT